MVAMAYWPRAGTGLTAASGIVLLFIGGAVLVKVWRRLARREKNMRDRRYY
jgi:hypothetical protein